MTLWQLTAILGKKTLTSSTLTCWGYRQIVCLSIANRSVIAVEFSTMQSILEIYSSTPIRELALATPLRGT